ncbi:hypothetical protein GCM10011583_11850 [Streptomyces camponoticapitis]|uniref:Uncharacterized protein n=1 Tax=Streptomyces camponoticapitis TaxID=1616125 RepID=A0ABQ2E420_9ACTN|nr:hypothetical protein [Streptomyces camponoticapitis]GGJ81978.1 hypothetical protein GCM10011583_11850 [Streptomyces camponoticapitis]
MVSPGMRKPRKRWTGPEKWQVVLAAMGVLVAIITSAGQFAQSI